MRTWEKRTAAEDAGKTLERFLREQGFSKKEISRLKFRERGMRVDGMQCRSTEILRAGQNIVLRLEDQNAAQCILGEHQTPPDIGYEDGDVLVLNKPSGMSCHPGRGHYQDSLGFIAGEYLASRGEPCTLRPVGRLDKDTSGAVVFAKNQAAAARLWKQREDGVFHKTYQAVIHGRLTPDAGEVALPLEKTPGEKNRMRAAEPGCGLWACTRYRTREVLETEDGVLSLVEYTLKTGRTHQIRVHMASLGHPIAGDPIYGIPDGAGRLLLHAERVEFRQPFTGNCISLQFFSPFCQLDLDYFGRTL